LPSRRPGEEDGRDYWFLTPAEFVARIEAGEFAPLLDWLRDRIHRPGYLEEGEDLITRVTGSGLTHEPFMAYLWGKYGELYGVSSTG